MKMTTAFLCDCCKPRSLFRTERGAEWHEAKNPNHPSCQACRTCSLNTGPTGCAGGHWKQDGVEHKWCPTWMLVPGHELKREKRVPHERV